MELKEKTNKTKTITERDIGNIYKVFNCDIEDGDYAVIDVDNNKKILYDIYKGKATLMDGDIKGDLIYIPSNERLGILLEGYIAYHKSLMSKTFKTSNTTYDGDLTVDLEAAHDKIEIIKHIIQTQSQLVDGEL